MNIGLLKCDNVQEQFVSKHGQYPLMFSSLLNRVDKDLSFTIYDVEQSHLPHHINSCDAYLITGSRHGVYDSLPWIPQLEEFIRKLHRAQKKVIGICFGHQLIAQALGGEVIKSPKGWGVGMSKNKVIQQKPWMLPSCDTFNLLMSHQDQVVVLPKDAEVLASNELCSFYMMQIGNSLTIQGHPEFSKAYSADLLEQRKESLDKTCYLEAIQSLQWEQDDLIVAQWMVNFLRV